MKKGTNNLYVNTIDADKINVALCKYIDKNMFALDEEEQTPENILTYVKKDYDNAIQLLEDMRNDDFGTQEDIDTMEYNLDNLELLMDLLEIITQGGK